MSNSTQEAAQCVAEHAVIRSHAEHALSARLTAATFASKGEVDDAGVTTLGAAVAPSIPLVGLGSCPSGISGACGDWVLVVLRPRSAMLASSSP